MKATLLKLYKLAFPIVALWIVYAFMHLNEFTWHFCAGVISYVFVGYILVDGEGNNVYYVNNQESFINDSVNSSVECNITNPGYSLLDCNPFNDTYTNRYYI